jgi:LytS/YehU family sensor histidine kinase
MMKLSFIIYAIFPTIGVLLDYFIHGLSLTYIGLVLSVLIIYANIYFQKQKMIERQKNALMISQINPHFMYNTLSTIAAMCDISPKKAKQLTIEFSSYLRQNLNTLTADELIPFEQELKHIECYLNIEKARFGDRLNILYSIQCQDFFVPALSIQPIVENAVRHGITKRARGGTIRILSYATDKEYIVEIKDDGVGFDTEKIISDGKKHVGIENVKNRLHMMCKGKLEIKSTVGIGTRITVEIPKKKGK